MKLNKILWKVHGHIIRKGDIVTSKKFPAFGKGRVTKTIRESGKSVQIHAEHIDFDNGIGKPTPGTLVGPASDFEIVSRSWEQN